MVRSVVAALSIVGVLVLAVPAHATEEKNTSEVTFVHGIRGFFADVYLDDELILPGFAPERITDPLTLEAGEHRIDLREADAPADAKPAVTKTFMVPAGGKMTAIAHWTGVEDCTITLFDDTGDVVAAGSGKLVARHAAATGEVEFALDDHTLDTPLRPSDEVSESVDPGEHTVAISGGDGVSKSSSVPVPEGSARVVYLVGSEKDDTLGLLTQTVDGLESNPSGVPTGNSGLAATPPDDEPPLLPLALLAVVGGALLVVRRRRMDTARG
jgi:hypothetical protein